MKIFICQPVVVMCLLSFGSELVCFGQQQGEPISVLNTEEAPTNLNHHDNVPPSNLFDSAIQSPLAGYEIGPMPSVITYHPTALYSSAATGGLINNCVGSCARKKCRCAKPAPVPLEFCLVDPCGCNHVACIEVPVCCLGEQPEISWRQNGRGRQVATLCWNCCDHQVKVIITRNGKVRTRG